VRRVLVLAASILTIVPVEAADWLALRTEHQQVAGTVSAKELKNVALRLEQFLNLRTVGPGEQRTFGTVQAIECRRDGIVIVVRTPQGVTRASAASLAVINFVTFRSQAAGSITCGAQTEVPALLTFRADAARMIAVALELLPDGYVP
jgi:hypothetical protein